MDINNRPVRPTTPNAPNTAPSEAVRTASLSGNFRQIPASERYAAATDATTTAMSTMSQDVSTSPYASVSFSDPQNPHHDHISSAPGSSPKTKLLRYGILATALGIGVAVVAFIHPSRKISTNTSLASTSSINQQYGAQTISLSDIPAAPASALGTLGTVSINGNLNVQNALVLEPTTKPSQATAGQLYYNEQTHQLSLFNGTNFATLLSGSTNLISSIGNATGAIALGTGLAMQNNTLQNTGVTSITAGSNVTTTDDGHGNVTINATGSSNASDVIVNNLVGDITLQGTANQLTATTTGSTITFALDPQVSLLGQSISSSEIADGTITGIDIANSAVALGTKTSGNYVAGVTAGTGITVSGTADEAWSPTVSLDTSYLDTHYAAASGSTNYIQNQTASAQTADFKISGTGTIQGNLTSNGQTLFKNSTDSTTAFQVQDSNGSSLLTADTTNMTLTVTGGKQITFVKTWGGAGTGSVGNTIVQLAGGGYVVTGWVTGYGAGDWDMYLAKYDAVGNLQWNKTWGGTGDDLGHALVQTTDGDFVVAGSTGSYGAGSNDMFLVKYDSSGNLLWNKIWGGTGDDYGYGLTKTADGGFVVTGSTGSYGAGSNDMFLVKYDSSGNLTWNKTWGGTDDDEGVSIAQSADGGFVVTGFTNSYGAGDYDTFLVKYDNSGNFLWNKTWGSTGVDWGRALAKTIDGGYAVTGYTNSYGAGSNDVFLVKFDNSGSPQWSKTWGGTDDDQGYSLNQAADGGYVVTGYTMSYGGGSTDMFLAKYGSSGALQWSKTLGGTGGDIGRFPMQTADGGYMVTGQTVSYGVGNVNMFLAKYDSSGNILGCTSPMCQSPTASTSSPMASTSSPTATTTSPTATTGSPTATVTAPNAATSTIIYTPPVSLIVNGSLNITGTYLTNGADLAENYTSTQTLVPGEVVVFTGNSNGTDVVRSTTSYQTGLAGVVSTNPGMVLGHTKGTVPLALTGRVPVKVSTENGTIHPGDYLTSSSTPGVAMKATTAGTVIGQALQSFDGTDTNTDTDSDDTTTTPTTGTIQVFIEPQYYTPAAGGLQGDTPSYLQNGDAVSFTSLNVSGATTLASLEVSGNVSVQGNLVIAGSTTTGDITVNGHIITAGDAPQIELSDVLSSWQNSLAGTLGFVDTKANVDGSDTVGEISITVGSDSNASVASIPAGTLVQVTFAKPYGKTPHVILSPSNGLAMGLQVFVASRTADGFTLKSLQPLTEGQTYAFSYWVAE